MKLGVTLCFTHKDGVDTAHVSDATDAVLAEFGGEVTQDRWFGWIVPMSNRTLRRQVFDAFCSAVPHELHPCWESPHITDVELDDLEDSDHILSVSLFESPSEGELESGRRIRYSSKKTSCVGCSRRMTECSVDMVADELLSRHKGVVQLPSRDMFCNDGFKAVVAEERLTGITFSPFSDRVSRLIAADHELGGEHARCESCRAARLRNGFNGLLARCEDYQYDLQTILLDTGRVYVQSKRMFDLAYELHPSMYKSMMRYGIVVPTMGDADFQLMAT